jgi:hypothetical protein
MDLDDLADELADLEIPDEVWSLNFEWR